MLRLPGLTSALSTVVPYALEGPGYIPEGFKYLGITETTWTSAPAASKGQALLKMAESMIPIHDQ